MKDKALQEKWGMGKSGSADKSSSPANENPDPQSSFFGVDTQSKYILSIKFMYQAGQLLYLPYSLQPIVEFDPDNGITIKTMQKEVIVKGRGLVKLVEWLGAQKVSWIKESLSGTDDASEEVFVESIQVNDLM